MNTRVFNLPLSREQYTGILSGERTIYLPETPYWTKRLYTESGAKPIQRVNIRLGASGSPRQFVLQSITYTLDREEQALYRLSLGREIHTASAEVYRGALQLALGELIWQACDNATAYAAHLRLDRYKRSTQQYRKLHAEYRHIMCYNHTSEYRAEVEANARDLMHHWHKTCEALIQTIKHSIERLDGESPHTLMHCEAILGLLYVDLSVAIHQRAGKPQGHQALIEVNQHLAGILDYFAGAYQMGDEWRTQALALLQTDLIKYRQLHQWMTN